VDSPHATSRRSARRKFDGARAVWLLNAAIVGCALALYFLVLKGVEAPELSHIVHWWELAPVFAATELFVVHVHFRRSAHSMSLGEVPLVIGLLLASPTDVVLAQLVGSGVVLLFNPGRAPMRLVFNIGQYALAACIAAAVFHAFLPAHPVLGPDEWSAAFAGTLLSSVVGVLLIGMAVTLTEAPMGARRLFQMLGTASIVTLTNTSLGLAGGTVIAGDPRAAWLMAIPACTMYASYRAYMSERRKHESLEFLYGATRSLSRAQDTGESLTALLELSLQAFRAELAEVVLFPGEDGRPALRASAGSDKKGDDSMCPVSDDVAEALRSLVQEGRAATLRQPFPEAIAGYLKERGVHDAMLSPLQGETRVIGAMLVANRLGVARDFTADDLKLLDALSNQAGASLEHDRLEQTVWRLQELQEQLEHQAFHDPLTGLANRVLFVDRVAHALSRRGGKVTVLFLDLDDFKVVNDRYGHANGDELLRQVAHRVRACLRPVDTPARMGGDEFAILLEDADGHTLMDVAERIVAAFRDPFLLSGTEVRVKGSLGVASNVTGAETAEDLLRNADVAMYTAKTSGKDRFASFEPEMHEEMLEWHSLKEELEAAVERDEFVVEYQPITDLTTGEPVALEALVRWEHPTRGRIAPIDFIPLAEETGLIVRIGRIVVEKACKLAREWSEARPERPPISVHVNASAPELQEPDFLYYVNAAIESAGIDPRQLVIEITESLLISDAPVSIARLEELRRAGVRLALDDFGTGYSSLSYLRWLPLDIVKMDKSFVNWAGHGGRGAAFARTIADLAHTLGLDVVAEGIETEGQLHAMRSLGCEMGQGYWFAPPAEARLGRGLLVRAA
jgi:diguanylate cyclase (GGDEF)-like protein